MLGRMRFVVLVVSLAACTNRGGFDAPRQRPADDVDASVDTDGDGLFDVEEAQLGSDPELPDSDGDGIDDGDEAPGGQAVDSDGDGVPDLLDWDSDDGGEPDLIEAQRGRDPTDPGDDLAYADLVVDVITDELDGGASILTVAEAAPGLSLREALVIAGNRVGPDRIQVSEAILGAGAVITVISAAATEHALPRITGDDTFIDGDGVTVAWDFAAVAADALFRVAADRVTVTGLVIDISPATDQSFASEAPLYLDGDPGDRLDGTIIADVSVVNNALSGLPAGYALYMEETTDTLVYRFTTGGTRGVDRSIRAWWGTGLVVRRCDLASEGEAVFDWTNGGGFYQGNRITTEDEDGMRIGASNVVVSDNVVGPVWGVGISVENAATGVTVSDNRITDAGSYGLSVTGSGTEQVSLRRNLLLVTGARVPAETGIYIEPGTQNGVQPPTVVAAADDFVAGDSLVPGTVDVYVGDSSRTTQFLGSAPVSNGTWRLDLEEPLTASSVTATVTDDLGNTSALAPGFIVP